MSASPNYDSAVTNGKQNQITSKKDEKNHVNVVKTLCGKGTLYYTQLSSKNDFVLTSLTAKDSEL